PVFSGRKELFAKHSLCFLEQVLSRRSPLFIWAKQGVFAVHVLLLYVDVFITTICTHVSENAL
ncbi:hypothetical protein, partial [Pseudomonas aeruginosa]|uniref:hypothetical protein n=1 Tax=Pseudomonas aeruginosa TaxID=287 RepID=UPI0039783E3D